MSCTCATQPASPSSERMAEWLMFSAIARAVRRKRPSPEELTRSGWRGSGTEFQFNEDWMYCICNFISRGDNNLKRDKICENPDTEKRPWTRRALPASSIRESLVVVNLG